jgi:hypothetical protein
MAEVGFTGSLDARASANVGIVDKTNNRSSSADFLANMIFS